MFIDEFVVFFVNLGDKRAKVRSNEKSQSTGESFECDLFGQTTTFEHSSKVKKKFYRLI